jgi:hypothetical protein
MAKMIRILLGAFKEFKPAIHSTVWLLNFHSYQYRFTQTAAQDITATLQQETEG